MFFSWVVPLAAIVWAGQQVQQLRREVVRLLHARIDLRLVGIGGLWGCHVHRLVRNKLLWLEQGLVVHHLMYRLGQRLGKRLDRLLNHLVSRLQVSRYDLHGLDLCVGLYGFNSLVRTHVMGLAHGGLLGPEHDPEASESWCVG
jgi:hypothetical protein